MSMLTEKSGPKAGSKSFSRSFPFYFAGLITMVWLLVGVYMVWQNRGAASGEVIDYWTEAGFGGYLSWGRDFAFITVLPVVTKYLGESAGKLGEAVERMRNGGKVEA